MTYYNDNFEFFYFLTDGNVIVIEREHRKTEREKKIHSERERKKEVDAEKEGEKESESEREI